MADKTEGIKKHAKQKSETRQSEVLAVIRRMKKKGEKVTFYGVAKATGASKSYLYNNKTIADAIRDCRDNSVSPRSKQSEKAIIAALRVEIKKLKSQIKEMEIANNESYKAKYEKLFEENKELKKQLENAYTAW